MASTSEHSTPETDALTDDQLLTERAVATLLQIALPTLHTWRRTAQGPPWVRVGARAVRYPVGQLREWLRGQQGGRHGTQ